jgi:hypothetical protein
VGATWDTVFPGPLNERFPVSAGLLCWGLLQRCQPDRLSVLETKSLTSLRCDRCSRRRSSVSEASGENSMTVKTNNRSHRVVYLIVLLVFAVALTTALVLAGERKPEGNKSSSTLQPSAHSLLLTVGLQGLSNV